MDGISITVDVVSIAIVVWILAKLYSIESRLARIEEALRLKFNINVGDDN